MKLFADKDLTKEVQNIDFGIVLAGDTKKVEYFIYNETDAEVIELKLKFSVDSVKTVSAPETLASKSSSPVTFEWSAPVTVKKGLLSEVTFNFYELYS